MDHQPPPKPRCPSITAGRRKSWHKPEVTLLPVEQTLTERQYRNDGSGPITGS